MNSTQYTDPTDYGFLPQVLRGVDVATLGESIHMTHEFSMVRLGIVRELNEQLGFHTLAFEGSPLDLWAMQDRFLASARGAEDAKAATGGLLSIWDDPEYEQLLGYEAKSWSTSTPLYLTAWDIQPGNGSKTPGKEAFRLFAQQLHRYAAFPAGLDEATWLRDVDRTRCQAGVRSNDVAAIRAIDVLQQWISIAQPTVQKAYPRMPHALILALIPGSLRRSMALCPPPGKTYWDVVGRVREEQAATYTLELQDALPNHKLMLWGHTHHMGYFPSSEASRLRGILGARIYSLDLFSNGGGAIVLYANGAREDLGYSRLCKAQGALSDWLRKHGGPPLFVDLRETREPLFQKTQEMQFEARCEPILLPRIADGIFWVPDVHPPHYRMGRLLLYSLWHVRWSLCFGVALLVLLAMALFVRWPR